MTKIQHKRTAVALMFHNDISQNTKCAERDSCHKDTHIHNVIMQAKCIASYRHSLIVRAGKISLAN